MAHQDPWASWSSLTTPRWTKKAVPARSCPLCISTVLETHHDRSIFWVPPATNATQRNQHLQEGIPSLRLRNSDLNGSMAPSTTQKSKLSQSLIDDMPGVPAVIEMRKSLMPKRRLVSSYRFAIPTERYAAEVIFKRRTLKILGSGIQRPRPSRRQNGRPNHRTFLLSHLVHMVGLTVASPPPSTCFTHPGNRQKYVLPHIFYRLGGTVTLSYSPTQSADSGGSSSVSHLRHVSHTRQNSRAILSPYISQSVTILDATAHTEYHRSHWFSHLG